MECGYRCESSADIISHGETHKMDGTECRFVSSESDLLEEHLEKRTAPFTSEACDGSFNRDMPVSSLDHSYARPVSSQIDHIGKNGLPCNGQDDDGESQKWNTGQELYLCSMCSFTCAKSAEFKLHLRTHDGEKPFTCPKCAHPCKNSAALKGHMRTHTDEPLKNSQPTVNEHKQKPSDEKPFSCSECRYTCATVKTLKLHIRTHSDGKPLQCTECDYACIFPSILKRHMRIHTGEKPYSCTECGKSFFSERHLARHVRIHTGEKPYSCTECDYASVEASGLKKHVMRRHTGDKSSGSTGPVAQSDQPPAIANLNTTPPQEVLTGRQMRLRVVPLPPVAVALWCRMMSKFCLTLSSKRSAMGQESSTIQKPKVQIGHGSQPGEAYRSSTVPNDVDIQPDLIKQEEEEFGGPISPTEALDSLWNQQDGKHEGSSTKSSNTHLRNQSSKKPFSCSECGKGFSKGSRLKEHIRSHTGERPFPCSECGKGFLSSSHLKRHMLTHGREMRYSCAERGENFSAPSRLERHMRMHMGGTYSALPQGDTDAIDVDMEPDTIKQEEDECGGPMKALDSGCNQQDGDTERPNSVSNLNISEGTFAKADLTSEKPFRCLECGKGFSKGSRLKEHVRTHTGERPFTCTECGNGFVSSSQLKRHLLNHTGERPYSCIECGAHTNAHWREAVQLRGMREEILHPTGTEAAHATAHRREAVQLFAVRLRLRLLVKPQAAHSYAQRRAAVQLYVMQLHLRPSRQSQAAHAETHRREAVHLSGVRLWLCVVRKPHQPFANARGKAVQLFSVPLCLYTVGIARGAHAKTHRREAVHLREMQSLLRPVVGFEASLEMAPGRESVQMQRMQLRLQPAVDS
ncbi:unnamed protein product [Nesidiocoris tenuis]|uniref:C2H2-type domain-containing protein n=1 Tax=Nesidiocoris tenuis TaxID=355587 RepID=A0A6H5HSD5_9HEMI|nr:unnamed protein product [Nesidiocoris tenuis]